MRKKIFGLAIIAISLFAANGIAQTPSSAPAGRPDKTKVQKCDRKEKCQRNLFEGLNLTADQQQKLQQLDSKRKADRKSEAKEIKQKKQEKNQSISMQLNYIIVILLLKLKNLLKNLIK